MAVSNAPRVKWKQLRYAADHITVQSVVDPPTVNATDLGTSTEATEFKAKYGDRPLWDAGIVQAGETSPPYEGEFLLINNIEGAADISPMINVTLNVTDRNGESRESDICGETGRRATLLYRLFKKVGVGIFKYGVYNREDATYGFIYTGNSDSTNADSNISKIGNDSVSAMTNNNCITTFGKSQIVHNVANVGDVNQKGGTIYGDAANWNNASGTERLDTTAIEGDMSGTITDLSDKDMKNYARFQLALQADSNADAGTIFFVVRVNYQYQ